MGRTAGSAWRSLRSGVATAAGLLACLALAVLVVLAQEGVIGPVAGVEPLDAVAVCFLLAGLVSVLGFLLTDLRDLSGALMSLRPRPGRALTVAGVAAVPVAGLVLTVVCSVVLLRGAPASRASSVLVFLLFGSLYLTGEVVVRLREVRSPWLLRPVARPADVAVLRERVRAVRRLRTYLPEVRNDRIAPVSAPLAAAAWDGPARDRAAIGAHLAGNEAETLLFALPRLAYCCRRDGTVPLDPAARLRGAAALAEHAYALRPGSWFTSGALALVRLAEGRPADARMLVIPHLATDPDPQLLAIAALAELPDNPARALSRAEEAARGGSTAETVRYALEHIKHATADAR